ECEQIVEEEDAHTAAAALRESIVRPAQRSPAALSKQTRGITADGLPVHSFRSLLAYLATSTRTTVEMAIAGAGELTVYARPRRSRPGPSPCSGSAPSVPSSGLCFAAKSARNQPFASRQSRKLELAGPWPGHGGG